jgi:2-polyprenyl-3-methyl-5-hydroxy-6-metoxy-1,4-benzoquinol methylase
MRFEEVVLENHPCPLDCPANDELVLVGRDRLHNLPGDFQVVKCRTCGLLRTDPRPTPETIGFYYPQDYGPYLTTRVGPAELARSSPPLWKRIAKQVIELNIVRIPRLPPGRVLEIGCASGAFLHRMASKGWQVKGIEFSERAATWARSLGYPVHCGSLETAPDDGQSYHLIVGWMVLEHLHNPIQALRKLRKWARPGGWLALSVPNAASLEFSLFKSTWYALHLPNHLYHYTPQTMARVLERGGWRMERIFYQRDVDNVVASLGYLLEDRKLFPSLAQKLSTFPAERGRKYVGLLPLSYLLSAIGQTGRMTVWARPMNDQSDRANLG